MNYEEKVSIIIPVYNEEKWIRQTIENLKEQTYKKYEIILIDDGSTDKSKQIILEYTDDENIRLISLEKNVGPAIARNEGLKIATGRFICFQDADDLWDKHKLEKQINFMKKNDCAFSYTAFKYLNDNKLKKDKIVNVPLVLDYKKALKDTRILTTSVMLDRNKINKELLQMPNVPAEDVATWWNILKNGFLAYGLDEVLVYYHITSNRLTSNKFKSAKNRWNVYRKVEGFNILQSLYYFSFYIFNAIRKRL